MSDSTHNNGLGKDTATIVPREGSALYYAIRSAPRHKRESLTAVLHLCHTLGSMLNDVTDPSVAEKKIHWWHEELERMQAGRARHPSCVSVSTLQPSVCTELGPWHSILTANNEEKFINATDQQLFLKRLDQDFSARIALCCEVLQIEAERLHPGWASGFGLFDRLQRFHHLHAHGYPVFPDADYTALSLAPHEIGSGDRRGDVQSLFGQYIELARRNLSDALNIDGSALQRGSLPVYVLAAIRVAQLNSWQHQSLLLSEAYSTPTPLKKAWLTWRSRAQYRALAE